MISLRTTRTILFFAAMQVAYGNAHVVGADPTDAERGDRLLAEYFRGETRRLADDCLSGIDSWTDWTGRRDEARQQLREMLGLDPLPERTPLEAVVTGVVDHDDFVVENLHFQSRPKLYVTANLYRPKQQDGRAPAILYLCGHAPAVKDGVSYGNKTMYQHHGAWFARHGYVCLVLDTLQLGEIAGTHHGTYRENMWWWNAMGYTPAGVEAWNAVRALDYLQSRPEVDGDRLGVTGRSGGGASSWWIAALDDRIKAAVPVAGITNLQNHVVDGCVEGHCDCMYVVNTYEWDYAAVAALVAPRPLLLSNTDHDTIFPLDGVMDLYWKVRHIYDLAGSPDSLGLQVAAGPHDDLQVLQLHAFQWFNHWLKGDDAPIDAHAPSYFELEQLKVFTELPGDAINARAHESFTRTAPDAPIPSTSDQWAAQRSQWLTALREKCFRGWPDGKRFQSDPGYLHRFAVESGDVKVSAYEIDDQVNLPLYLLAPAEVPTTDLESIVLHPLDAAGWAQFITAMQREFPEQFDDAPSTSNDQPQDASPLERVSSKSAVAYFAPRGIGPTAWAPGEPAKDIHIRRRFMLLGQTLDGMRVWDTRRAIQAIRAIDGLAGVPLTLRAEGEMAGIALYAALFEPPVARIELSRLPRSHREGPDFLNVLRVLDLPQAVALAAENSSVRLEHATSQEWAYPLAVAEALGWKDRIEIENDSAAQ